MAFARRVRKKGLVRRYAGLCLASFIMALGIALVTNANLGTTPITSLPYALSAIYSLSLGATTFLLNMLLVALQKILLWKEFPLTHLLQLPAVLLFSIFIDLCMWLTTPLITTVYPVQILLCLAGCAVLGLGISLEIVSDATVQPAKAWSLPLPIARMQFSAISKFFLISPWWLWQRAFHWPCCRPWWDCARARCLQPC